jgi:O-antigen ligase
MAELKERGLGDRAAVWSDAVRIAKDFPIAGTGLNTFGTAMLFRQTAKVDEHFEEAHNDYLQLAVEGGVLLGLPAAALILLIAGEVRRRFGQDDRPSIHWMRVGAVTALLTMALQESGEFALQMPGNAALFCVVAAIALHAGDHRRVSVKGLAMVRESFPHR